MKRTMLAVLMLIPMAAGAANYVLEDEGDFAPAGHRVEFADRYGWRSYKIKFDFGLDARGRSFSEDSSLSLRIARREGGSWNYVCRGRGKDQLSANINFLRGKGISVVAECRIDPEEFAKAVNLYKEDVGSPNLVFHAMIVDGEIRPGSQIGLYFSPSVQIESPELNTYVSAGHDASDPSILFQSFSPLAPASIGGVGRPERLHAPLPGRFMPIR